MHEGNLLAYIYPVGEPFLTERDRAYFRAIREALITGFLFAGIFSIVIGFLFGHRLSYALKRLARSISSLGDLIENHAVQINLDSYKLPERFTGSSAVEIRQLVHSFNILMERSIQSQKKLIDESTRDSLTGLYNRRHFDQQSTILYEYALRADQPLCLVIADIDFFKKINDGYSHQIGDEVLIQVARIMEESIRGEDILARYGGEEFVLILPRTRLKEGVEICNRIRLSIASWNWERTHTGLKVTMSMGVSNSKDLGSCGKMLVEADKYLYLAKRSGRNRVCFPEQKQSDRNFLHKLLRQGGFSTSSPSRSRES